VLRAARFGIFFRHEEAPKKEAKRRWSRRDGLAKQVKGQPCDDFAQMPLRVFISAAFFGRFPPAIPRRCLRPRMSASVLPENGLGFYYSGSRRTR
jgi:hypothetical protein